MVNSVTPELIDALRAVLPAAAFRTETAPYLEEPRGRYAGRAGVVVAPQSADQVAAIIRVALSGRVGIVPYGGGTGLVGGQVQPDGSQPIVLSVERLNKIRSIDGGENVVIAEAGVTLSDLHSAAEAAGRLFPLSYASKGSARIGGALSVNSGGVNVLRYGNARDLCLGLEAVLPNGEIWHGLKRLRKDNTGYDLRNLLIGAEGTLAVITAASLRLFPQPARTGAAFMTVGGPADALRLLELANDRMGGCVSAFELIAGTGLEFLREAGIGVRYPFENTPEWMVLVEIGVPEAMDPDTELEALFSAAAEAGHVGDGVVARSEAQRRAFWDLREALPAANKRIGAIAAHDVSLPLGAIPAFLDEGAAAVAALGDFRVHAFGHLGDGNLHYNIFPPPGGTRDRSSDLAAEITRIVHDLVGSFGGSFSAEHGVGRLKVDELERYGDPVKLSAMRAIKTALDPLGIMNPGAVLRIAG